MRIRDLHAQLDGDDTVIVLPSGGLEIVADDGRALFIINLDDNVLSISGGSFCKHKDKRLENHFFVKPVASNKIDLIKREYTDA